MSLLKITNCLVSVPPEIAVDQNPIAGIGKFVLQVDDVIAFVAPS
jgi:hypothetical protein